MVEPIFLTTETGKKIRIISPIDYDNIVAVIEKPYLLTIFNITMWTGLRYEEIRRLHSHQEWVMKERRTIYLNAQAQKKVKRKALERHVPIPAQIGERIEIFLYQPGTAYTSNLGYKLETVGKESRAWNRGNFCKDDTSFA